MPVYIAFLRGINVGGHNKIKMAELKNSLQTLGLQNIKTYIQSGNVIFESKDSEVALQERIQTKIKDDFEITSTVVIRTADQLHQLVSKAPFSEQEITEATTSAKGECLHVAMLPESPKESNATKFLVYTNEKERCVIDGRDVYLLFYESIRNSKLHNNLKLLEVPATVRNWRTLNKILLIIKDYEENKGQK
ncbi:cytoplasmic protein [Lottiidibacillus patelloidae]|uniref:Cytoplasmic protein n=1 Tax=Lottiidibacillus patelloidae TaxID=2670334 RepID=A0A263BVG4_9BACI|nr:DUF1697 domain-containing protein [Lottiidibacillus patelloidae]OZM57558.1 cytoplasmic protein [Lottiidibacillus patelloidae]